MIPSGLKVAVTVNPHRLVLEQKRRVKVDAAITQAAGDVDAELIGLNQRMIANLWARSAHCRAASLPVGELDVAESHEHERGAGWTAVGAV